MAPAEPVPRPRGGAGRPLRHPRGRAEPGDGLCQPGVPGPRRLLWPRRLRVGGALGALRALALAGHADRRRRHRRAGLRGRHSDAAPHVVLPRHGHPRHRRGAPARLRPAPRHHGRVVRAGGDPALGPGSSPFQHLHPALLPRVGLRRARPVGGAQYRQLASRPRAARARRERGRGGGDGGGHRGGEAPRLRPVRGVRVRGGQPVRALHHGDQPRDLLVSLLGRPRPDGGDRRDRPLLGGGGGRGAPHHPARGPAQVRGLGGAALRARPHRRDPVPPARHRRTLRAQGPDRAGPRPGRAPGPPRLVERPEPRRRERRGRSSRSAASASSSAVCGRFTTARSTSRRARSRR